MICNECGGTFKKITNTHLRRCCGMTEAEYLAKHPGFDLVDENVKQSYGLKMESNPNWRGGISKPVCKGCRGKVTEKSRIQYCRKCSQAVKGNPFQGKTHTEDARRRMVEAAKHRNPATYHKMVYSPEQRKQLSLRQKQHWADLTEKERSERLQTFIAAGQRTNKKNVDTKIEQAIEQTLIEIGAAYLHTYQIGGHFVDFVVGNKVIECYGDYWHCNPQFYSSDTYRKSLHMLCSEKRAKDENRLENQKSRL